MKIRPHSIKTCVGRLTAAAAATFAMSTSQALPVYMEIGDAGELTGTAQAVNGSGALTAIRGGLIPMVDRADLFGIQLTSGTPFSATTTASSIAFNNFDTALFLFSGAGLGLVANDDDIGSQSTISFTAGATGTYYLAIAGAGYNPVSAGGLIFPSLLSGGQFGPTGPGGGSALSGWNSTTSEGDVYEILLTGAGGIPNVVNPVPVPGTALLAATGLLSLVGLGRHRGLAVAAQA